MIIVTKFHQKVTNGFRGEVQNINCLCTMDAARRRTKVDRNRSPEILLSQGWIHIHILKKYFEFSQADLQFDPLRLKILTNGEAPSSFKLGNRFL